MDFMPPRTVQSPPLRQKGVSALAVYILIAGLCGYGLSRFSRSKSPVKEGFLPQVYDTKTNPNYNIGVPMRPMDVEIFQTLATGQYSRTDLSDLYPKRPYLVKFIGTPPQIDVIV